MHLLPGSTACFHMACRAMLPSANTSAGEPAVLCLYTSCQPTYPAPNIIAQVISTTCGGLPQHRLWHDVQCAPWVLSVVVARSSAKTPEDERPPHTPNSSSTAGAAQQLPPASRLPAQHAPVMSTAVALPPQVPHASSQPAAQQCPARSSVAAAPGDATQQAPPSLTTPMPPGTL